MNQTPSTGQQLKALTDEFYATFGEAVAAWARVEMLFLQYFILTTNLQEEMARRIYYSSKTFTGRADMIAATLHNCHLSKPYINFVKTAVKTARQYYGFRNSFIHGEPLADMTEGRKYSGKYILIQGKNIDYNTDENTITMEHLKIAAKNYGRFSYFLLMVLKIDCTSHDTLIDKYRMQVLQLPNPPHSKICDQIPEELSHPPPPSQE